MLFVAYHKNKHQTPAWAVSGCCLLKIANCGNTVCRSARRGPVSAYSVTKPLLCSFCFSYWSCTLQSFTQANLSQKPYSGLSAKLRSLIWDSQHQSTFVFTYNRPDLQQTSTMQWLMYFVSNSVLSYTGNVNDLHPPTLQGNADENRILSTTNTIFRISESLTASLNVSLPKNNFTLMLDLGNSLSPYCWHSIQPSEKSIRNRL